MKYSAITGPIFEQHDKEGHVESQDRLLGIIDLLPEHVTRSDPIPAAPGDIERIHHPGYLKWLRQQCERNVEFDFIRDSVYIGGNFTQSPLHSGYIDENTYLNPHSYEVATYAAGSAIAAVESARSMARVVLPWSGRRATMLLRHGQWVSASSTTWPLPPQKP